MQKKMHWEFTEISISKNESLFFWEYFFNTDLSVAIAHTPFEYVFMISKLREDCLKMPIEVLVLHLQNIEIGKEKMCLKTTLSF